MTTGLLTKAALLLAIATTPATSRSQEPRPESPKLPVEEARVEGRLSDKSEARSRKAASPPRVLFITNQACDKCRQELARLRRPGGDFEALVARGWKIGNGPENHIQIVDRDEIPELVEKLEVREFPTVACVADGEIVRSFKDGCTTPLDVWTFGWLIKGENERPHEPVPEPVRVASTGSYRLRGNHWSVDGDWNPPRETLISHLRGPNHGSQIAANYAIESWSYEELRSLHDDLHESEIQSGATYTSYGAASSSQSSSGFGAARKMLGR